MSTRFLPTQEATLDAWLANFSAKNSAAPTAYGLSSADASDIKVAVDAWHAAFEAAAAPSTRTRGTVSTKRGEKKNVVGIVRGFAGKVRSNGAVSAALKIGLGLKLRDPRGAPVPAPEGKPFLSVRRIEVFSHALEAGDTDTRPSRGKPRGAAGLMVFRAVGDTMANGPEGAQYLTLATRTSFSSTFTPADRGKIATYFARWVNSKGEVGPWSQAMSAPVAA